MDVILRRSFTRPSTALGVEGLGRRLCGEGQHEVASSPDSFPLSKSLGTRLGMRVKVPFTKVCHTVLLSSNRSLFLPDLQMASATGPQWNGYWKIPQNEIEIKEQIGKGAQARNVFRAFWKTRPVAAKNITFFSDREVRQN